MLTRLYSPTSTRLCSLTEQIIPQVIYQRQEHDELAEANQKQNAILNSRSLEIKFQC